MSFDYWVTAVFLPRTVLTLESCPNGVELINRCFHEGGIISQNARLKVSGTGTFHSDSGTCKDGRADVGHLQVKDDNLEMDTWTQSSLQAGNSTG